MSTDFRIPKERLTLKVLFDGRLERFGVVEEHVPDETTETSRCLTDGQNWLWVSGAAGNDIHLRRSGFNAVGKILSAIEEAFDVQVFSEHQPQFWGFETQEEWDAQMDAWANEARDKFYDKLTRYVAGEPSGISPGTIGESKAKIAKALIEDRPELASPGEKENLLNSIDDIYDRDHAIVVRLDE
jgi:hypothetical protein